MQRHVHGILLLDKPVNLTSNGALQRVKRLFRAKKAGHTGSLDPLATGMLPICFGEATKFSQFLLQSDKSYEVVAKLGVQTTTGDLEGEITAKSPVPNFTAAEIEKITQQFIGDILQVPPMYSAIKYQGKPLYQLARRGIEVPRDPRSVTIFSLTLNNFSQEELTFHVHCSKGTYIRTLVEDIGRELGCGAHVIALRRLTVSPYGDAKMYTLDQLEARSETELLSCLLPMQTAVNSFPAVKLSTAAVFYLRTGQAVRTSVPMDSSFIQLLAEDGRFLGIGEVMLDGRVKPHRMIAAA